MPIQEDILSAKILLVDDSPYNLDLLRRLLVRAGYTNLRTTSKPQEVCALHAAENFDLIILDMEMPGMSGFDVMLGLKEIEKGGYLPVLALTGHAELKNEALGAGARDFISKPFDIAEVQKRIHNMLEVRLLYKALAEDSKTQQALALHDPLTGLPNRRLLDDRLESALRQARRHHRKTALMFLDLDGFKKINDTYGHACGDQLLQQVAQRLVGAARAVDTVARLGGDEFIMVLTDLMRVADVDAPAGHLVETLSAAYLVNGNSITLSASIGVSVYPDHALKAEALMGLADQALYEAKHLGKNRYCVSGRAAATADPLDCKVSDKSRI